MNEITYNGETHSIAGWARIKGVQEGTLRQRLWLGWPVERALCPYLRKRGPRKFYTVYDAQTDELICMGSAKECADMMGIVLSSFHSAVSRFNHGTEKKYAIYTDDWEDNDG